MKHLTTVLLIIMALSVSVDAMAQMDKKEKKAWKKRLKKVSPEQYKDLIDQNKTMKSQVSSLRTELDNVDRKLAEKDDKISQQQAQIADLRSQVRSGGSTPPPTTSGSGINENVGVVFKVQIGAYKKIDLSKYKDSSANFNAETEGELNKYTIGVFKDYWEADTFKKYLRAMGVKDAWIVSYRDGTRVPIKDVLEGSRS